MTKLHLTAWSVGVLLTATGCMHTLPPDALPAVVEANPQSKKSLEAAASELLSGRDVSISPSAFADSNKVSIERRQQRDDRGLPINGREMDLAVMTFTLWTKDQACWLKREDNGKSVFVDALNCKAMN